MDGLNDNGGDAIDFSQIAESYRAASQRYKTLVRLTICLVTLAGLTILVDIIGKELFGSPMAGWKDISNAIPAVVCLIIVPISVFCFLTQKRMHKIALNLTGARDVLALGPLIERIGSGEIYLRDQVAVAIMHLLPMLDESNKDVLSTKHWKLLCKTLDPNLLITFSASQLNVDYFVVVLDSMATIGDTSTLIAVQRLAVIAPKNAGQALVKQHAEESLLKMRERLERQSVVDGLLRPVEDGGDALLRPVQARDMETEDKDLLRPVN